jgi:uncharacterized protein YxjI
MIKKYDEFINEEINLKKAVIGGVMAGALATGVVSTTGCETGQRQTTSNNWSTSDITEIPDDLVMSQKLLTIGTDMDVLSGNKLVGKVEERVLNWGKTFEYFDNNGNLVAKAKERVLTLYTIIDITDASGNKLGSVEQEVLESLFSVYSKYSIKDASGSIVGKSSKLEFFTTDVDIEDNNGGGISLSKDYIEMFGDTWRVNINSDIDKRLIIFIPAFVSSAQSSRSEE